MRELTFDDLDRDGAFCAALDRVYGLSRAEFLRKAAVGSGALLAALAMRPQEATAGASDVDVLNFDLTFEYLQASFYTEAERVGTVRRMSPAKARFARVFGSHERAHVKILKKVLGRGAVKRPFFDFQGVTESEASFVKTVVAMEDLTTALLTGQLPLIKSPSLVSALMSLISVEARHAAWARHIFGAEPAVNAFDEPKSLREVDRVVASTGFMATRPRTWVRRAPRLLG